MKNVTLAVDEKLLDEGRRYARQHHTSLNGLLRDLLRRTVRESAETWIDECIGKMDKAGGRSGGRTWTRGDLYDV
jgi:hypothetical protein